MRMLPALALSLLLGASTAAQSPSQPHLLAIERAKLLHRGVNASMWFAQASDYSPARLRSYTTAEDMALRHRMGFDHVRLSIDGDELLRNAPPDGLNQPFLAELDTAVHIMLDNHLRVIVDVHPSDEFKQKLSTDDAAAARFVAMWTAL